LYSQNEVHRRRRMYKEEDIERVKRLARRALTIAFNYKHVNLSEDLQEKIVKTIAFSRLEQPISLRTPFKSHTKSALKMTWEEIDNISKLFCDRYETNTQPS
jgi:hypothetical protein